MDFPSWWGPEEGPPVRYPNEAAVPKGYVHFPGDYNVQTGQWEMPDPLDHDGNGEKGGSKPDSPPSIFGKSKAALFAIAADEGVEVPAEAKAKEIQAAIKANRAG